MGWFFLLLAMLLPRGVHTDEVTSVPWPTGGGVDVGWSCCNYNDVAITQSSWWTNYFGIDNPLSGPGQVYMTWNGQDMKAVSHWAQSHPGHVWITGNEPNVPGQEHCGDNMQQCADAYRGYASVILQADPTSRIVGPGLGDADITYAQALVDAHADAWGSWNIHYYTPVNDPYNISYLVGKVQAFQSWQASRGDTRPLILGEWGLPPTATCVPCAQTFMTNAFHWLQVSGVQAWGWFSLRSNGRWSGDLIDNGGVLTPLGSTWKSLMTIHREVDNDTE